MIDSATREALKQYDGKTIVVKYGGAAMQSDELKRAVANDVAELRASRARVVLSHGGGPELTALQRRLGMETKFVDGLRYTDAETIDVALMALCGKVNKDLARCLENAGACAVGLSGIDGGILRCVKKKEPDLGFVGELTRVDTALLRALLDADYIPVVSTVGLGEDGLAYNINADTAAAGIAAAFAARFFVTMSDVPGVLRDVNDPSTLVSRLTLDEADALIADGVISGGMIPKIRGLMDAVRAGIGAATIVDGRIPHALLRAFEGKIGTTIV